MLDAASVWFWSPLRRVCRRPRGGHPARVEKVGLTAPQVGSRREGGAEAPLSGGEAAIPASVLEGEQAGGGGETEGV